MATKVRATIRSGTPSSTAIRLPLSTIKRLPRTMAAAATTNFNMLRASSPLSQLCRSWALFISLLARRRFSPINSRKMAMSAKLQSMLSLPSLHPTSSTPEAAISSRHWGRYFFLLQGILMATMATAMMSPVLAITEPTALPIAMSTFPPAAAITETIISGIVVARLTMVAPMMKVGISMALAIQPAASTKASPPLTTRAIPTANSMRHRNISINLSPPR